MITLDLNLKVNATHQWTNFPFNSMVKFNGKYLGASDEGLHEIGADDDDGTAIDAYFEPLSTDFGLDNPKRIRFMYLGFETQGELLIETGADDGDLTPYAVETENTGQQRKRIPTTKTQQGRYYRFVISNVGGCDFSIDSLKVGLTVRNQGIYSG